MDWFLPFIARRQRKLQHLPDGLPRQAELARRLPDAHAVYLHGSPYTRIYFHLVHLPVSHKTQRSCNVLELIVWWSTFRPPQNRRSRGVLWSIIALPFIGGLYQPFSWIAWGWRYC